MFSFTKQLVNYNYILDVLLLVFQLSVIFVDITSTLSSQWSFTQLVKMSQSYLIRFLLYFSYIIKSINGACDMDKTEFKTLHTLENTIVNLGVGKDITEGYVQRLDVIKLRRFASFCQCKYVNPFHGFCHQILKKIVLIEGDNELSKEEEKIAENKQKREACGEDENKEKKEEREFVSFVRNITEELKVKYVVIMLDKSEYTFTMKLLIANIFKDLSNWDIRTSVHLIDSNIKNISEVVGPTGGDRPTLYFLRESLAKILLQVSVEINYQDLSVAVNQLPA